MKLLREGKELLSVTELASALQVSVPTVTAWHKRGTGPKSVLVGQRRFYNPKDVNRWLVDLSAGSDQLGVYREPYNEGYRAASEGAAKASCRYLSTVGELGLRTAWIAGWHQFHDEQGVQHEAA